MALATQRKFPIIFLLTLYLLGVHAGAHGVAWCLGAQGHGHLELNLSGCALERGEPSCDNFPSGFSECAGQQHSAAECHHQPVHGEQSLDSSAAQTQGRNFSSMLVTVAPAPWSWPTTAIYNPASPRPPSDLPHRQSLIAHRTIVLLI